MKQKLSIALFLLLFLSTPVLPCRAAEESPALISPEEIEALLAPYVETYGLHDENFALGYLYTGTGEEFYCNGDLFLYGASLYKLPLCMNIAERVAAGEFTQDSSYAGYPIYQLESLCLIESDNRSASAAFETMKLEGDVLGTLARYSGYADEDLPVAYRYNRLSLSPRFMINTLRTLYEEPERFPNISECLLQAQPDAYFRTALEGQYDVEQKYGNWESYLHTAGIIHTPTPFLLVVMTDNVADAYALVGELAQTMTEYTLSLDKRLAAAQATPSPTPAPRPTPKPAPAPTATPLPTPTPEALPDQTGTKTLLTGAAAVLLASAVVVVITAFRRSRRRPRH